MSFSLAEEMAKQLGRVSESDTGLQSISIARIAPNKRNFYPRVEDFEGLKDSIAANGLLEPLTVVPGDGPNTYRLISGENRYRAIRALYEESGFDRKWEFVTCLVLPTMTEEQEQCAVIESNRQRKKSGSLLAEEAKRLTEIYVKRKNAGEELPGRIRDRVAEALKVSSTKLAMLNAIRENLAVPGFMQAWKEGRLSESVAYEISKLDREVQYRLLDWQIDTHRTLTIGDVKTFGRMWTCCPHNCPHTDGLCPNAERMIREKFRADEFLCPGCCERCLHRAACSTACQYIPKEEPSNPKLPQPEQPEDFTQTFNPLVWYPSSIPPEFGQDIIVVDSFGYADSATYRGDDFMDYGIRWSDVAFWTFAPSEATSVCDKLPQPEGQLMICGWMPGGTTPREPCLCACMMDLGGDSPTVKVLWWDGYGWLFKRKGQEVQLEPMAWLALPEYEGGKANAES